MSSSDVDTSSQIESEDTGTTDSGDTSSANQSESSWTPSGVTSNLRKSSLCQKDGSLSSEQCVPKAVSVDFTEVSDLDDSTNVTNTEHPPSSTKHGNNGGVFDGLPYLNFSSDWYNHDCFKKYWEHYRFSMAWCRKHYKTWDKLVRQQKRAYSSENVQHQGSYCMPAWFCSRQHSQPSGKNSLEKENNDSNDKTARKRKTKQKRRKLKTVSSVSSTARSQTESEFEMEITQDMIDFFAKSHEHRQQRGIVLIFFQAVCLYSFYICFPGPVFPKHLK